MGDISAEPSMEDILSSIKRIIAEEGEASVASRSRRSTRSTILRDRALDSGEVLELSDPVPTEESDPVRRAPSSLGSDAILSQSAAEASRGALDSLSRVVVTPPPPPAQSAAGTLEDTVREMLRPMLREWLDAKLPGMVEAMVAREIARITQGR